MDISDYIENLYLRMKFAQDNGWNIDVMKLSFELSEKYKRKMVFRKEKDIFKGIEEFVINEIDKILCYKKNDIHNQ